ncbi:hypothetical protein H1R20_g7625, partial [Candolleomyces eurysporus]
MVVSRRNPVAPPPVASRSNSSQAIPRKQKQTPQESSPLTSTTTTTTAAKSEPSQKSKRRTKSKSSKSEPRNLSFLDRLFLFSLLGFAAYAVTVCSSPLSGYLSPSHTQVPYHEQPQVCRALITYRTAILEPYVLPPLKVAYEHTLGHAVVKEQYKTHVQPHINTLKGHSKPAVDAAVQVNERVVKPAVEVAYDKVWKGYVVPWYYQAYLPRYRMYVAPRLQVGWEKGVKEPLKPYGDLLKTYARDAQVYVHANVIHPVKEWYFVTVHPYYVKWEPQVVSAYNTARPVVCRVYGQAKDVSNAAWIHARPHVCRAWKQLRVYFGIAVKEGGKARRTYVDPHVHKILERVSASASPLAEDPNTIEPTPTFASSPEPTPIEEETAEYVIPVTPPVDAQQVFAEKETPPSPSPVEVVTDEYEEVTPSATPTSTPSPSSVKADPEEESAAPGYTSSVDPQPTDVRVSVDEAMAEPSGPAGDAEENVAEQIADALVRRVQMLKKMEAERIAQEEAAAAAEEEEVIPEPTPLSKEEELAAIAAKRKRIVTRHQDWQRQLDEFAEEQIGKVVKDIEGVRIWAVSELGEEYAVTPLPSGDADSKYRKVTREEGEQGLGKRAMGGVERQGAKLVKGLESYLVKAVERSDAWKMSKTAAFPSEAEKAKSKEERDKWDEVLVKVEERFNQVVRGVQGEVHEWYKSMKGREVDTAKEAALAIKHLAEKAQADLAMDYAWLEDVTYKDWDLYHHLMRTYERFERIALAIQDGTYTPEDGEKPFQTPGPDPLVGALDKLQAELDDIVLGWQVSLGAIKKRGIKIFSERRYKNYEGREGDADDNEGFFSVKREKGELVDDMRGVPGYQGEAKKPIVSILPVGPGGDKDEQERQQRVDDASAILIGKDPVQVAEAVSRASALGATVLSSAGAKETERVKDEL